MEVLITEAEVVLGLIMPTAINLLLLYNKYDKWYSTPYKWYAITGLFVLAAALLRFVEFDEEEWYLALRAALIPLMIVLLDYAFKKLSFSIQNRDYRLWLRDMAIIHGEWKYSFWDKLLSIVLLLVSIFMPLAIVLIYRRP